MYVNHEIDVKYFHWEEKLYLRQEKRDNIARNKSKERQIFLRELLMEKLDNCCDYGYLNRWRSLYEC